MKNFTKIALVFVLVLVILGSVLCAVGMGIGFTFSDFMEQVDAGEFSIGPIEGIPFIRHGNNDFEWDDESVGWDSEEDEDFTFSWKDIKKIEMELGSSSVNIIESDREDPENVHLKIEYRNRNHKHRIKADLSGDTLEIESNRNGYNWRNDSARVTLELPMELMKDQKLEEISLEQESGYINVEIPLTARKISINVGAGKCESSEKLTAQKEMSMEVDAGKMDLEELEAEELKIKGGVGDFTAELIQAEKIDIEGGVGRIEVTVAGKETDYSYDIECGVGRVEIGDSNYSGLGSSKSIQNPGSKEMQIECGIGNVGVYFENE